MSELDDFKKALRESLKRSREAFEGQYAEQLEALLGLSREEIDAIAPGNSDLETYEQLITVVKEASRANISQAQLKTQIEKLGDTAVAIARMAGPLAVLI